MTTPPPDRHPGYGPTPPAGGTPQQPHPGYGAPQQPAAFQPGRGDAGPRLAPNPLGFASMVVGAIVPLLGVLFLLIQAAAIRSAEPSALGAISSVGNVLGGLLGVAALVLGLVALTRRGASKTFAAAGVALGASAVVSVIGAFLYGLVITLMYG